MLNIMELNIQKNGKPCIYCIKNKVNNKVYIGSAIGHFRRKGQHYYMLRNNSHFNKHLQNSWNKYKEENFEFIILEFIENVECLEEREEYYIKLNNSKLPSFGYNHRDCCKTNLGNKWPIESKIRFSISKKGKPIQHLDYEKLALSRYKKVSAIDRISLIKLDFNSIKEASCCLNIDRTCISKALNGKIKSAGNYYWKFSDFME